MRKRCFAAARGTGNDIEREFGKPTTDDFIKARNAGRQFVDYHFIFCGHAYLPFSELRSSKVASGHALRNRLNVKASPRNVRSRPRMLAMRIAPSSPGGSSPDCW